MTRELIFWALAALMAAAAAAAAMIPLVRAGRSGASAAAGEAMNRELLTEELENLRRERDAGLIGEASYAESVEDVQRRALEELQKSAPKHATVHPAVGVGAVAAAVVCALAVYGQIGSAGLINFVSGRQTGGIMQTDGSLGETRVDYDADMLTAYLARNPEDERAQTLLARLYVKAKDWKAAAGAYEKAVAIGNRVARDPIVLAEWAASLMSLQTDESYAEAADILERALMLDERDVNARELAAIAALELRRWGEARKHLELLLTRVSMDTHEYRSIADTAAYAASMERMQKEGGQNQTQEKPAAAP